MEGEKRTVKTGPGHTKVTRLSPKGEVYAVLQMVSKIEPICLHILRTLFLTLIPSVGRLLLVLRRDHIIFISPLPPFHFTRGPEVAFPSPLTNNNLRDQLGCSYTESSFARSWQAGWQAGFGKHNRVIHWSMTSLSYGRVFCLESQKINGTYQRYNHYFRHILFILYK